MNDKNYTLTAVNKSRRNALKLSAASLAAGTLLPISPGLAAGGETVIVTDRRDCRIKKAEAIPVRVPFKHVVKMAKGSMSSSKQVLVRLEDEAGRIGWGEAVNYPAIYGHGQKQIFNFLTDYLLPSIIGLDPLEMGTLHRTMDKALPYNHFSKSGIDNAAYDIAGKQLGVPVHALLGGAEKTHMPLAWLVGIVPSEEAARSAAAAKEQGYRTIKVKAGIDWRKDIARIRAVRKASGDAVNIRVDANANYDRHVALKVLEAVEDLGLQHFEQPCRAEDIEGAAWLAAKVNTPIAADESVHGLESVFHVLSAGAASVINIKFVRSSGIYPAIQIASLCESLGVKTFLGGAAELGMGIAAMTHYFCSTTGIMDAGEATPNLYEDNLLNSDLGYSGVAGVALPQGPGMGFSVDPFKLAKYRLDF